MSSVFNVVPDIKEVALFKGKFCNKYMSVKRNKKIKCFDENVMKIRPEINKLYVNLRFMKTGFKLEKFACKNSWNSDSKL